MDIWVDEALRTLKKSLFPIPQELNELDWKSGLSDKTDKLIKHICAFANYSGGGFFAYGINNNGDSAPLTKDEIEATVSRLGNIARHSLSEPVILEHAVVNFNGEPVLFIYVHEQEVKPVNLKREDIFESYTRNAGQTVKLSKDEVKSLIAVSKGMSFEKQIAADNLSDIEVVNALDYGSYFNLLDLKMTSTLESMLLVLANDSLIKQTNKGWNILNIGAILFAKDINMFDGLKRKSVRVIVYKGSSRVHAIKEQEGAKGYASGFKGLISYIMDKLPANEIIENALRKNVKIYPDIAIREFVANALIHQDFSIKGAGVMVEIFDERIEITNPGAPLVDTNRFIDAAPKSRNEALAGMMRRLNICEERGSGIDRAISAIEIYQLPAPKFIKGDDYTRIILYAPIPLSNMAIDDRVRACYQHTCLQYVSNQSANNQSVRKRFNI